MEKQLKLYLIAHTKDLKLLESSLLESIRAIRKLYMKRKRIKLYKIALLSFAMPEPIITNLIGTLLIIIANSGEKIRIDEMISKELSELRVKFL